MLKVRHKLFPRYVLHPGRVERRVFKVVPCREGRKVDERTVGDRVRRNLLSKHHGRHEKGATLALHSNQQNKMTYRVLA